MSPMIIVITIVQGVVYIYMCAKKNFIGSDNTTSSENIHRLFSYLTNCSWEENNYKKLYRKLLPHVNKRILKYSGASLLWTALGQI